MAWKGLLDMLYNPMFYNPRIGLLRILSYMFDSYAGYELQNTCLLWKTIAIYTNLKG